jgi:membrane protein implicated in regulation of membrane protease activity
MILLSISSWWNAHSAPLQVFWGLAIIFTILFLIQTIIALIGLDFDSDTDVDIDLDLDLDGDMEGGVHLDSGADLQILSVRGFIVFCMLFGWSGLIVLHNGGSLTMAFIVSILSGLTAMVGVAYMFYGFMKMQSEGNIHIENAMGESGDVYLRVPANLGGKGKVHVKVQGQLKEFDAMTRGKKEIPTGAKIKVVDIRKKDNVLFVEEIIF